LLATGCNSPAASLPEKNGPQPGPESTTGNKEPTKNPKDPKGSESGVQSLPKEVADAWGAAKGFLVWMYAQRGYVQRRIPAFGDKAKPGEIPAFSFDDEDWKIVPLAKLPEPPIPFGINVSFSVASEAALKDLARFKNLHGLGFANTAIKDFKALGQLTNLRWLDLTACGVDDASLKELAGLRKLELLNLGTSKVSSVGLKELASMTDLHSLDLHRTNITDDGLKELTGFKKLKWLNISSVLGESKITDAGVKNIAGKLDLQMLILSGTQVTDAGVKELAAFKNLKLLWLHGNNISDASAKTLSSLSDLEELNLGFTRITDDTVKQLAGLKKLQVLSTSNTKTSDASLKALAELKNLRELYLSDTTTEAGVAELRKALPKCKIFR
jgi:hypothetical protein